MGARGRAESRPVPGWASLTRAYGPGPSLSVLRRPGRPNRPPQLQPPPPPAWSGIVGYLVRLLGWWALTFAILAGMPRVQDATARWFARLFSAVFSPWWSGLARSGALLMAGGATIRVIYDCTPCMAWAVVAAAILSFPAAWRQRLAGLAMSATALIAYDLIRLAVLLALLTVLPPATFEWVHFVLWQALTCVVMVGLFTTWVRWQR